MSTYIQVQERIANDLKRNDLATEIADALQSAIQYYRYRPVVQGQSDLTAIPMVSGQKTYTLPSDFIAPVQFNISRDSWLFPMTIRSIQWIDAMDNVPGDPITGIPLSYAMYGETSFHVWPRPNEDTQSIVGRYTSAPAAPSADDDETFWTTTAERAIRCRAVALLYDDTLHDTDLADREYNKADNEWKEVVRALELRAYASGIRPFDTVFRPYR